MIAAPGWVRFLAGGAGFAPVCAFTVAYLFPKLGLPVAAFAAGDASGLIPFSAFIPTSLIAWAMHHDYLPRSAVEAAHGSLMRGVKLVLGRLLAL